MRLRSADDPEFVPASPTEVLTLLPEHNSFCPTTGSSPWAGARHRAKAQYCQPPVQVSSWLGSEPIVELMRPLDAPLRPKEQDQTHQLHIECDPQYLAPYPSLNFIPFRQKDPIETVQSLDRIGGGINGRKDLKSVGGMANLRQKGECRRVVAPTPSPLEPLRTVLVEKSAGSSLGNAAPFGLASYRSCLGKSGK